jgi:hypothetical protein
MTQAFDYFGEPELPYIILENPNREELYSLKLAYNTKLTLRFNALSEFSFTYPKSIDNGLTTLDAYAYIQNKRLVFVEGHGYFMITDAQEDMTGAIPLKNVQCKSQESELTQKTIVSYGGTKKFYDIISPSGTLLWDMIQLAPTWSIGTVDADLLLKYRTFNTSNSNIYNFMMNDVSKAYECVFFFDTVTKTISAKTIANATTSTDIYLSFDNIIKTANLSEKSDEIVTCMAVYGGGNLNIRTVNPLGTDKIYDFSYYANTSWMTQGLVTAIANWNALVNSAQAGYSANLLLLETYNADLLNLQAQLATYNEQYLALEGVQKTRIQQGLAYGDINTQMTAKKAQITSQNTLITNKNAQITTVTNTLHAVNLATSFAVNFTPSQLLELDTFIYQNTYKNENIIQTDTMTQAEIQAASQTLYDQAKNILGRVSQPRYEIGFESVNYIVLPQFSVFTNQTALGGVVTCELQDGTLIQTVLLEMGMQLDNPSEFTMTYSNRVRLDGGNFSYSDLVGEVVKTGASVAFDNLKWANWENNYKDDVTTFITSALDATINNLISNTNQEIVINQNGLRARQSTGSGTYSQKQAWLVNNVLAFSNDGFTTSKLALGEITLPAGGTAYGLVGDVIVGKILAGNSLTIANSANNFVLDSSGATLNNAKFTLATTNAKVIIDPTSTVPFRIQKNVGGTFTDKFWVDNAGNVNFSGNLTGATGTFTGTLSASVGNIGTLVIDSLGLKTADGVNYLRGDGSLKWGGLSISGGSATFSGTIYADKLVGQVNDGQIATGLSASKVTNGYMSGNRIYGGTCTFDSIQSTGGSLIVNGGLIASGNGVFNGLSVGGFIVTTGSLSVGGSISVSGGSGISSTIAITTPYGTRYFDISRGIIVGYHS